MLLLTDIQIFVKSVIAYNRISVSTQSELIERFMTFQFKHKQKLSDSELADSFNYAIELIFIETGIEYSDINKSNLKAYRKERKSLIQRFKLMLTKYLS